LREETERLNSTTLSALESSKVQENKIENLNSSIEVLQHELQKTDHDLQTVRGELEKSSAELRTLKVQLETTTAQKTEAEEQVKAEAKKSSDLNGLLGTFREKLKTEREQGAASLSGMSDKLQTDLTMANDAHAAEVARTTKVIGDIERELSVTKARMVDVLAEKALLSEKSSDLDRKVTDLTNQLATAEQKETVRVSEVARLEGEAAAAQKVRR
jgi:chromosome segregation ATPase